MPKWLYLCRKHSRVVLAWSAVWGVLSASGGVFFCREVILARYTGFTNQLASSSCAQLEVQTWLGTLRSSTSVTHVTVWLTRSASTDQLQLACHAHLENCLWHSRPTRVSLGTLATSSLYVSLDVVCFDETVLSSESIFLESIVIVLSVKQMGSVPEYMYSISPHHPPQWNQSSHCLAIGRSQASLARQNEWITLFAFKAPGLAYSRIIHTDFFLSYPLDTR